MTNRTGSVVLGLIMASGFALANGTAGTLDSGFDGDGVAPIGLLSSTLPGDVVVQSVGTSERYLVGGTHHDGGWGIVAYASDGSVDETFGPRGDGTIQLFGGDSNAGAAVDLLIDGSNRILAVGASTLTTTVVAKNGKATSSSVPAATVVRLDENGALDATFGGTGVVRLTFSDSGAGVGELSTGRLVVSGRNTYVTGSRRSAVTNVRTAVACLDASGILYSGFGSGGVAYDTRTGRPNAGALVVQADDAIVVAGPLDTVELDPTAAHPWGLTRWTSTGVVDASFGVDGHVASTIAVIQGVRARGPSGGVVACGYKSNLQAPVVADRDMVIAAYSEDGALDMAFGEDGYAIVQHSVTGSSQARSLAVEADGAIVFSATLAEGVQNVTAAVGRLASDGSLDATFGTGGFTSPLVASSASRVALAAAGVVLTANSTSTGGPFVARYHAD